MLIYNNHVVTTCRSLKISHFCIIEENFEEFANVAGRKSKFMKFYAKDQSFMLFYASLFSKNFMIDDFMPSGTPETIS